MDAVALIAQDGSLSGHRADFVDGTMFGLSEMYLTVGAFSDVAPWQSDYTRDRIYYQSIHGPKEDFLTISDYLWRWDTDWFWCSRAFGVQHPLVRRAWPRRYRRSDVYRKVVAFYQRHGLGGAVTSVRGQPPREAVIQDVEIPVERGAEFLRFFADRVGMSPVWMCPLRLRGTGPAGQPTGAPRPEPPWPLYPLRPGQVYVNFGFWGTVPLPPGAADGYHNRLVEDEVTALGGQKGLYSTSFYSEEEFWEHYNGEEYGRLKQEYDGAGRLASLYEKCVRAR
jgi:FAD/FMN-containing dehydrogenase